MNIKLKKYIKSITRNLCDIWGNEYFIVNNGICGQSSFL